MKTRGFERVSFEQDVILPERSTLLSAGYDFFAIKDCIIPTLTKNKQPVLVPTGVKAYMQENEFLQLCNRSSNPIKKYLVMPNGVGIIDSDYYNNNDNEGHIFFQFLNFGETDVYISQGDKIGQGIFMPFLKVDDDKTINQRTGGFGSTGN